MTRKGLGGKFKDISSPIITLEYTIETATDLKNNAITTNISEIDGLYIMYFISDKKIKIMDVSRPIEMQYTLLWTTLLIILCGTLITF